MAPMVAQSDLPFRHLCRQHDTDLCFTQMIHAANFARSETFQAGHLDVYRNGKESSMTPSGMNALKGLDWDDWLNKEMVQKSYHQHQHQHQDMRTLVDDLLLGEKDIRKWATYQEGSGEINP